ncbi:MAG: DUF4336 domain-containing protein [Ectothiorhodospiraceae bacterium]|jgi:hypothetical protein
MQNAEARRGTATHSLEAVYEPYRPLFVPKPVAENLWVVDGGIIRMSWLGVKVPFPTRMTIIRLGNGDLWLHSPVEARPELVQAVSELGRVRYLVSPNPIHYWWLGDWRAPFPEARALGLSGAEKAAERRGFRFDAYLDSEGPSPWGPEIEQVLAPGGYMNEMVFFHAASRTLILTDLIENFEPSRLRSRFWRFMMRITGAADPDGKAPIDLRLTFLPRRRQLRQAVERMLAWHPERVILAHGRWYESDGESELRRGMRWTGVGNG